MTDWRISTKVNKYNIEITELAEQDLEDASDYIAYEKQNLSAAINLVNGIRETINTLDKLPERFELDDDEQLADIGIRTVYYKNYKIFYLIKDNTVYIVRILHMLVDSKAWLYRTLEKFHI